MGTIQPDTGSFVQGVRRALGLPPLDPFDLEPSTDGPSTRLERRAPADASIAERDANVARTAVVGSLVEVLLEEVGNIRSSSGGEGAVFEATQLPEPDKQRRWVWRPAVVVAYSGSIAAGMDVELAESGVNGRRTTTSTVGYILRVPLGRVRILVGAEERLQVSGAGLPEVNGLYCPAGFYDGVPRLEKGGVVFTRFMLPSGNRFWYIADKHRLHVDDGNYYRIKCEWGMPPVGSYLTAAQTSERWVCARDGVLPVPSVEWDESNNNSPEAAPLQSPAPLDAVVPGSPDTGGGSVGSGMVDGDDVQPTPISGETPECDEDVEKGLGQGATTVPPCCVCQKRTAAFAVIPCGHLCLCPQCVLQLQAQTTSAECPLCRVECAFMQRILI